MEVKNRTYPSIFNDVIGPVMRGPSSSHCAAALRIGRIARDLMGGGIDEVVLTLDSGGSLATTHKTQGSDMGLFAGLLGMDITDERLKEAEKLIHESVAKITIQVENLNDAHPNTYNINLKNNNTQHYIQAISTGGGIVEIIKIDEFDLSLAGDYFETIILYNETDYDLINHLKTSLQADSVLVHEQAGKRLIEIKSVGEISEDLVIDLKSRFFGIQEIRKISPVLPVLSGSKSKLPFVTFNEMLTYQKSQNLQLWQLAVKYESARGKFSQDNVLKKMSEIVDILESSIEEGLSGTEYKDRILGYQSGKFAEKYQAGHLLDAGMLNRMTMYVTALMEVKSSLGIIVAAPTAGACGALPGAIIGAARHLNCTKEDVVKAMLAAGLIGVFIAQESTFAAEVCGCQAETGSAAGMAAAGLVHLAGGDVQQALNAASMALQNTFGMTCDPVANRVEVPCLGKNVMAAANALVCANMALAGFDALIPLDEVIDAMYQVGKSLPHELRCTALGGLSVTKTSRIIEARLLNINGE